LLDKRDTKDQGGDRLFGEEGEDELYGGNGKDFLFGGADNDRIEQGEANLSYWFYNNGNDTYRFSFGDGADTIHDSGGFDTVLFKPGVTRADMALTNDGNNHLITLPGGADRIYPHERCFVLGRSSLGPRRADGWPGGAEPCMGRRRPTGHPSSGTLADAGDAPGRSSARRWTINCAQAM
jgi:Ca2+-binding RTX toxin-like protein